MLLVAIRGPEASFRGGYVKFDGAIGPETELGAPKERWCWAATGTS